MANRAGRPWSTKPGTLQQGGDSTGQDGCRSSLLGHPARSFFRARDAKIGKPPVEAAGAVDAKNAPTAPWKNAQNAVSHSSHRPFPVSLVTGKVLPMFPVAQVSIPLCRFQHASQARQQLRPRVHHSFVVQDDAFAQCVRLDRNW